MKMKPEHYAALSAAIAPIDNETNRNTYRTHDFGDNAPKDLNMRYRWDLFWGARGMEAMGNTEVVYAYLNDTHIDTALRSIVAPL